MGMYFVTGLDHVDYDKSGVMVGHDNPKAVSLPRSHTFGFFKELEDAKYTVESNDCDINEGGYYKYMVIEYIDDGYCYPTAAEIAWYRWEGTEEKGKYIDIPKPDSTRSTCNFAF